MKLFPELPPLPGRPRAFARPSLRMRILGVVMAAGLAGLAIYGTTREALAAAILGTVAGTAAAVLAAKLCCMLVLVGDGWVAERRLGTWMRITLDGEVAVSSSSSWIVGGDWLRMRHDSGAMVALWSSQKGAREALDLMRDDLRRCRVEDPDTRERLWPQSTGPGDVVSLGELAELHRGDVH